MSKSRLLSTLFSFCFLATGIVSAEQNDIRATLFSEVDATLREANSSKASVLAPASYSAAAKLYNAAEEMLEKGKSIDKIRKNLQQADALFKRSIESVELANTTFTNTILARDDAEAAQANIYAKDIWTDAERLFSKAATALEDGDINKAKKYSTSAEVGYRDVELVAIKVNYLDETRLLIEKARKAKVDRAAPKTLNLAQSLLDKAEKGLNENRYDTDESRLLAKQAHYEAKHAIYVANIVSQLQDNTLSPEDLILQSETPVVDIASALDLVVQFDQGLDRPIKDIRQQVENLRADSQELSNRQHQVLTLESAIASLERKLGVQSQRLAIQEQKKQRINKVEGLFSPVEALVLSQGDNLLIRTIGFTFDSGSDQISSNNFDLLKKIQQTISLFPNSSVIVEGHTDSFGSDDLNLELSKNRAEAIKSYIIANLPDSNSLKITAVGYGESKPIANNETSEGRKKNRRIDLIIIPAK